MKLKGVLGLDRKHIESFKINFDKIQLNVPTYNFFYFLLKITKWQGTHPTKIVEFFIGDSAYKDARWHLT